MPPKLQPYYDMTHDAGLALTDAGYAYSLLIAAAPMLTLAGLLVVLGLILNHGKSHGTRFSAMAVFSFAALAGMGAWLLRPDVSEGTMLKFLLAWSWLPPAVAGLSMFITMPKDPRSRALGLGLATILAMGATVFGGVLAMTNERTLRPDNLAWLDAPPLEQVMPEEKPAEEEKPVVKVVDTGLHRR